MARDPAINWYFDNWGGGTRTMSRFHKGCYIDLLDAQFQCGHLSLEEIKTVLGNDFAAWGSLSKKFAVDETGKYFNERLDHEINKRQIFSKKQYENGIKGGRPKTQTKPNNNPNVNPKESLYETEIGIETEIENGKGGVEEKPKRQKFHPPSIEDVKAYVEEKQYTVNPDSFFNFYASKNWFVGKNKMQDWHKAIAGWEARNKENLNHNGNKQSTSNSTTQHEQLNSVYASIKRTIAEAE